MGSGATAKYALPFPLDTDPPNIPGDVEALAAAVDAILAPYAQDVLLNRPAFGKTGRTFTQTDGLAGITWRDSGTEWRALGSRIQPNATGDIGQIVRAAAGQTADILHVEDVAGNPFLKVGNNGATTVTPGSGSSATQALLAQAGVAGQRAIVAKMATGATANPFEVQDGTGAFKARIAPDGGIEAGIGTGQSIFRHQTVMQTKQVSAVPLIAQGMTGQAVPIQQWQNGAGTTLSLIDQVGGAQFPTLGVGTAPVGGTQTTIQSLTNGTIPLLIEGAGSAGAQTADLQQWWKSSAGPTVAKVSAVGDIQGNSLIAQGIGTGADAVVRFQDSTGAAQGFVTMAGSAGHYVSTAVTGDMILRSELGTTWIGNNGGVPLAGVDHLGRAAFGRNAGQYLTPGSGNIYFRTAGLAGSGVSPGSAASNAAFRNHITDTNVALDEGGLNGTPWTYWMQATDVGTLNSTYPLALQPIGGGVIIHGTSTLWGSDLSIPGGTFSIAPGGSSQPTSGGNGAHSSIVNFSSAWIGQIIKGAPSQAQSLSVWQNSAGSDVMKVNQFGQIFAHTGLLVGFDMANSILKPISGIGSGVADNSVADMWDNSGTTGARGAILRLVRNATFDSSLATRRVGVRYSNSNDLNSGESLKYAYTGCRADDGFSNTTYLEMVASSGAGSYTYTGTSAGVFTVGSLTQTSDARSKEAVRALDTGFGLDVIRRAKVQRWQHKFGDGRERIGIMAEDLPDHMTHVVPGSSDEWNYDEDDNPLFPVHPHGGMKSVDLGDMVGVLWHGVGELDDRLTKVERALARA